LRGQSVDLGKITASTLIMAGQFDHIVLPHQAQAVIDMISSSDKEYYEYPIGHGGLVFGKVAKCQVYPRIAEWLGDRS